MVPSRMCSVLHRHQAPAPIDKNDDVKMSALPRSIDTTVHTSADYYDDDDQDEEDIIQGQLQNCLVLLGGDFRMPLHKKISSHLKILQSWADTAVVKTTKKSKPATATETLTFARTQNVSIDIDHVILKCCLSKEREAEILRLANDDIPEVMRVCRANAIPRSDDSVASLETFLPEYDLA